MSNYVYKPLTYNEYLESYVNSLKTGEILVDEDNHDIYITEEGLNVPLPKTKNLRNDLIDFLSNNVEGIKLKNELVGRKLKYSDKIKERIENVQQNAFTILNNETLQSNVNTNKYVFLEKFSKYNINQVGILDLQIDEISSLYPNYAERLKNLAERFNIHSTFTNDLNYSTAKNQELMAIWTEIVALFNEVNLKLNKLTELTGSLIILKNNVKQVTLWDVGFQKPGKYISPSTDISYHKQWDLTTSNWSMEKIVQVCTDNGTHNDLRTGLLCDYNKISDPSIVWADWGRPVWKGNTDYNRDREILTYQSTHDDRWFIKGNRDWPTGDLPKQIPQWGEPEVHFDYEYYRENATITDGNNVLIPIATEGTRNPHPNIGSNSSTLSVSSTGYYDGSTVYQNSWGSPWTNGEFTHYRMARLWYSGLGTVTTLRTELIEIPRRV